MLNKLVKQLGPIGNPNCPGEHKAYTQCTQACPNGNRQLEEIYEDTYGNYWFTSYDRAAFVKYKKDRITFNPV